MMRTIILDSRDKVSGSNSDFVLQFNPALINVNKATLLFGNIPTATDNSESYFLVQIPQLGISVRGANPSSNGTFILPVTSGSGFRSIHQISSDFATTSTSSGISINQLNVRIVDRTGTLAPDAGEVLMILEIE